MTKKNAQRVHEYWVYSAKLKIRARDSEKQELLMSLDRN